MSTGERNKIAARLTLEVNVAREEYEKAAGQFEEAAQERSEIEPCDGDFGLKMATRAESAALAKYARAVRALADFVIRGEADGL